MIRLTISVAACTEMMGLLVAMAWADGTLADDEKDGIRAAAKMLNLNKELRERLETFMESPLELDDVELDRFGPREREFAYVASAWMMRVDEITEEGEEMLLQKLGETLDIADERRTELERIAFDLQRPAEGETWAQGIAELFMAIPKKLAPNEEIEVEIE